LIFFRGDALAQVFDHLASIPIVATKKTPETEKLSETSPEFYAAMRDLSLLEAQELVIRKAVEERTCRPALVAKLCADVFNKASSAGQIFEKFAAVSSSEYRFRVVELYLTLTSQVYRNLACYHMALVAVAEGRHAQAISYFKVTRSIAAVSSIFPLTRSPPAPEQFGLPSAAEREAYAARCSKEYLGPFLAMLDETNAIIGQSRERAERENEMIYFEAVNEQRGPPLLPPGVAVAKVLHFFPTLSPETKKITLDLDLVPPTWSEKLFDVLFNE
jgi:hypothetical protein